MAKTFHLTIAKVGESLFDGDVESVSLPGSEGRFELLAGHEAFVSTLASGEARVREASGGFRRFDLTDGGVAEVSHNQATILL